jgi:L-alanine-DL-glutamate epimerase-like enolase superfamily enzyme
VRDATIQRIDVSAYTIPTDAHESDGTFEWDATTIVVTEIHAGKEVGLGYTYGNTVCGQLIDRVFSPLLLGKDALSTSSCWVAMNQAVRNLGRPGVASMAIGAVDSALWDLKARLLGVSLLDLLGRDSIPVYGSGGFTAYSDRQLQTQFSNWASKGITRMKMKVGRNPSDDIRRVRIARGVIGPAVELFVDANGALTRKQALRFAEAFAELGVTYFEEPVSSDDLEGLRLLRDRAPAGMDIAAGEYGYDSWYFRRMLEAGAVDILQADATRCGGITGFLQAGVLTDTHHLPLSSHTAQSLHAHVCCAVPTACHVEYFHDHARVEDMLFDGVLHPINGALSPHRSCPGNGLHLKRADALRYAA